MRIQARSEGNRTTCTVVMFTSHEFLKNQAEAISMRLLYRLEEWVVYEADIIGWLSHSRCKVR